MASFDPAVAFLAILPVAEGHSLVTPRRHAVAPPDRTELDATAARLRAALSG